MQTTRRHWPPWSARSPAWPSSWPMRASPSARRPHRRPRRPPRPRPTRRTLRMPSVSPFPPSRKKARPPARPRSSPRPRLITPSPCCLRSMGAVRRPGSRTRSPRAASGKRSRSKAAFPTLRLPTAAGTPTRTALRTPPRRRSPTAPKMRKPTTSSPPGRFLTIRRMQSPPLPTATQPQCRRRRSPRPRKPPGPPGRKSGSAAGSLSFSERIRRSRPPSSPP